MNIASDQLRSIVERIERMHAERKAISDDISEIYTEAKSNGFDTKALREVVKQRAKDPHERDEFEAMVDLYKNALGMLPGGVGTVDATRARANEEAA